MWLFVVRLKIYVQYIKHVEMPSITREVVSRASWTISRPPINEGPQRLEWFCDKKTWLLLILIVHIHFYLALLVVIGWIIRLHRSLTTSPQPLVHPPCTRKSWNRHWLQERPSPLKPMKHSPHVSIPFPLTFPLPSPMSPDLWANDWLHFQHTIWI